MNFVMILQPPGQAMMPNSMDPTRQGKNNIKSSSFHNVFIFRAQIKILFL